MEDRMNAGLLLVLLDADARDDLSAWDDRLRGLPGIARVSWWNNLLPDRRDVFGEWRRIKEDFATLAVCEIDGRIEDVARPEGVRSLLFRRAARPSQGVLRMPVRGLCLVLISPHDLDDESSSQAVRDWADFVHFPGIVDANIPGYGLVTPYVNTEPSAPRFMHLYEFPEADAETVFQMTRPCVAQRFNAQPGTAAFDGWATHPDMALDYVGNFARLEAGAEQGSAGSDRASIFNEHALSR